MASHTEGDMCVAREACGQNTERRQWVAEHLQDEQCGCCHGKSRLGWEVYGKVYRKKRELGLVNVAFVSINMAKDTHVKTVADLVQHILRTRATASGVPELYSVKTHQLSFEAVARHLAGWKAGGGRAALVLHVDEFQHNPATVLLIQDAIAAMNHTNSVILPICTGLYNKGFRDHKDLDASDYSHAIYLGYLSAADGAADHDAAWEVVRNAAICVIGRDVLPKALKEAPPVLRYLVEDLGGWPMAAVQLGGQLAAQEPLKKATSSAGVVWDDVQLNVCEAGMDNILNTRYHESATSLGSTLESSGIYKLVLLSEPINGMTVESLLRHGFVHLQRVVPSGDANVGDSQGSDPSQPPDESDTAFIRFSKPLLRLLVGGRQAVCTPFKSAPNHLGQSLQSLLKTCRDYHGDTEEAVQLLSFVSACTAYVLLTPASRPKLDSLADLRPGARVFGDPAKLVEMAEVIRAWAAAVDQATAAQSEATYIDALGVADQMEMHLATGRTETRENAWVDAKILVAKTSSAYITARHDAFKEQACLALCKRCNPNAGVLKSAALTVKGTDGIDAWALVGLFLYVMQCKGQETGADAGRAGGDETFQPNHTTEALKMFGLWLDEAGVDAASIAALELLTTKRMAELSKRRAHQCTKPVVVVARDALLKSLGIVFGGIAARCQEAQCAHNDR